jgi:hypothetical protein
MTLVACGLGVFSWRASLPKTPAEAAPKIVAQANPSDRSVSAANLSAANAITPDTNVLPAGLEKPATKAPPTLTSSTVPAQPAALSMAETIVGSWQDDFYGKRLFHFRPDGTATMTIELDRVGQLLYGPKLTFFIDWTLKDDVLTMKMTGGEPKQTATTVAKLFGETSEQRIERFSDEELTLRSLDSQKLYVHRRIAAPE